MDERRKKRLTKTKSLSSPFRQWGEKYWSYHSTGVRNWLLVSAVLIIPLVVLLSPAITVALSTTVLWALLISTAVMLAISVGAFFVTLAGAIIKDYAEYKARGTKESYLRNLLSRFGDWVSDHKFNVACVLMPFIMALLLIPVLIGLPPLAILFTMGSFIVMAIFLDGMARFIDNAASLILTSVETSDQGKGSSLFFNTYSVGKSGLMLDDREGTGSIHFMGKERIQNFFSKKQARYFSDLLVDIQINLAPHLSARQSKNDDGYELEYQDEKQEIEITKAANVNSVTLKYFEPTDEQLKRTLLLELSLDLTSKKIEVVFIEKSKIDQLPEKMKAVCAPKASEHHGPVLTQVQVQEMEDEKDKAGAHGDGRKPTVEDVDADQSKPDNNTKDLKNS